MTTDMISMVIPPPVLSESLFPTTEGDGDLELSCILSEIFPDSPDIEFETSILADHVPSSSAGPEKYPETTTSNNDNSKTTTPSSKNGVVPRQVSVSDCSLVSDDEMSQNNNSNMTKSASQSSLSEDNVDDAAIPENKATSKVMVPQPVVSTSSVVVVTPTPATSPITTASKKRSASEMVESSSSSSSSSSSDDAFVPGESKQKVQRRVRNREHAKKSRSRKKTLTKQLEESLAILKEENAKLKTFVEARYGKEETAIKVKKAIVTPNDRLVAALQKPSNRVLSNSAISYLKSLGSDFKL